MVSFPPFLIMKQLLFCIPFFCASFIAGSIHAQTPILVTDIIPGINDSKPGSLTVVGSSLFFSANGDTAGTEVWENSIGTTVCKRVTNVWAGGNGCQNYERYPFGILNGKIFFRGYTGINMQSLVSYDPATGTTNVVNTSPYHVTPNGFYDGLTTLGNRLYYIADSAGYGYYLCSTDGVSPSVVHHKVLALYGLASLNVFPFIIAFKGKLYFAMDSTQGLGNEMCSYDPTTNAMSLVADINPLSGASNPCNWLVAGNKLYFTAIDSNGINGPQIFEYDGVNAPKRLTSPIPGKYYSPNFYEGKLAFFQGSIYFSGDSARNINYSGLFRYDTLTHQTSMVYNPSPGLSNSRYAPTYVYAAANNVYFYYQTAAQGVELYKYNPTLGGSIVSDLNPGTGDGVYGSNMVAVQGSVYFNGNNGTTGFELYRVVDSPTPSSVAQMANWPGEVAIAPNPATANTILTLNIPAMQTIAVMVSDAAGRSVYEVAQKAYAAGKHNINLPLSALPAGQYFYHIRDASGRRLAAGSLVKE